MTKDKKTSNIYRDLLADIHELGVGSSMVLPQTEDATKKDVDFLRSYFRYAIKTMKSVNDIARGKNGLS